MALISGTPCFSKSSFLGSVTLPELASERSLFIFMFGIPTGDMNPIYNVLMLGTQKTVVDNRPPAPSRNERVTSRFGSSSLFRYSVDALIALREWYRILRLGR